MKEILFMISRVMKPLKIILFFIAITSCSQLPLKNSTQNIPRFNSLLSSGVLESVELGYKTNYVQASISINENYQVTGKNNCKAIIIHSNEENILAVAKCGDRDKYYLCANEPDKCKIYFETKQNDNSLILIKDWGWGYDKTRRIVEFHANKVVYRIQGESCLIGYPHGCIINGFSWIDEHIYTYEY